jgi:predicted nucleic acid-binding protein
MPKLYIDTNILMYALGDSENLHGKDISTSARKLLFEAVICKHYVIISNWTLKELELKNKLSDANFLLQLLKKKTIKIQKTDEDEQLAKEQNPENIQDQLHCILAQKAEADYIVTRNTHDFNHFNTIIPIVKPEKLL